MHDTCEIFGGAVELHRHHRFGDQFGHVGTAHVYAEHAVGLGIGNHLDHAGGFIHRHRAADGGERAAADAIVDAFVLDRKSTRLNSSHYSATRLPSPAYKKKA